MPNHLRNLVRFICEDNDRINQIYEYIKTDDEAPGYRTIDFNKIIPMPEDLNLETSSNTQKALRLYLTKISPDVKYYGNENEKISKKMCDSIKALAKKRLIWGKEELIFKEDDISKIRDTEQEEKLLSVGKDAFNNLVLYGHVTWYTWRVDNWNTKWNAYNFTECEDKTIEFTTAWEPPIPVIQELSKKFPDVTFVHDFTDECLGYNTGHMVYKDGNVRMDENCEDFSKRAIDISLYVQHETAEENGMVPSYDNTTYIERTKEYDKFTIESQTCIGKISTCVQLSEIPSGYYTYFLVKDKLCNFYSSYQQGVILSHVPLECDSYGICSVEKEDIVEENEMINIDEFDHYGQELSYGESPNDF